LIPVFLLSPIGGATADRHSRHRIMIVTQIVSMLLAFVLGSFDPDRAYSGLAFVCAGLTAGINYSFYVPAQSAFVVDMVGKEDLMNAIALNSSLVNGARIIGPAIAGLLVAAIGEGWCFFLNGVTVTSLSSAACC
jgi:MFS family permease